ncbi:hypothetical protein ES703_04886 [subsurface metagenome]
MSNFITRGVLTFSGRKSASIASWSLRSWAAKSRLVPDSNSTITTEAPSIELEFTDFTPETDATVCSIGLVRVTSTSSGLAPS